MILIATQTFAPRRGGMEAYMTGLADALVQAGREVVVFADGTDEPIPGQGKYQVRRFEGWRPLRRKKKKHALGELCARERVEGIYCDSWKSVEAIPEGINIPIVVLAHGAEYPVEASRRKRARIQKALARSTAILANSRFTVTVVQPFLANKDDPRLKILHPPINPLADPTPEASAWIQKIIGGRAPVLSVLARLEPRKGIDRVIAAMPTVLAKHPKTVFLIGGDGEDKERLQESVRSKGLGKSVVFLGALDGDKKAALLASSDVFTMPVRRVGTSVEGFGISYVEAAWFGVPSLGGKGSGAEDAVLDGQTGLLCNGDNQTEVSVTLTKLLDDGGLRRILGSAARIRVRRELLWATATDKFLAALQGREGR